MNKLRKNILTKFVDWLDAANGSRVLNIILMVIIILSVAAMFFKTLPESKKNILLLIAPIIAGINIYYLRSENIIVRETANFFAAILFIGFILCAIVILFMGALITKSL